jgi:hypothetical protein
MSRVINHGTPEVVWEDDLAAQAAMSDKVTVTDVMNHLELIAQAPNGTSDGLAARGAINLINELAAYANLDLSMLAIDVKRTA